jgi:N-acetyltransferase
VAQPLAIPTLEGATVRLEPLAATHADALGAAASEDRSTYRLTTVPSGADSAREYVATLLEEWRRGEAVPFAQVEVATSRVVGATRFLNLRHRPGRVTPYAVEIGGTWLAASAQRTGVNTEAKLLLMDHAFSGWDVVRVDFKTDARNERSRQAIARLGATFEGVLRNWQPSHAAGETGLYRDSAMFSVTAAQWPAVRAALESRVRAR